MTLNESQFTGFNMTAKWDGLKKLSLKQSVYVTKNVTVL